MIILPTLTKTLAITLLVLFASNIAAQERSVYEIPYKGPKQLQELDAAGLDVLSLTGEGKLHIAATSSDKLVMARWGSSPRLISSPSRTSVSALDANLGLYRTYDEMVTVINTLQTSHPGLVQVFSIGTTIEGRAIWAIKISDNVGLDEAEPELLIQGCLHARELMAVEQPLKFLEYLVQNYNVDTRVTQWVNEREIFFVPIANPDGYVHVQNNHASHWSNWWRKNRRNNQDGSFGVDLNRNYGYEWGLNDFGSSSNTSSNVYRGTAAFSEPETAALRDFAAQRSFVSALSYHSYSELLLYPWGYNYEYTTDHAIFHEMSRRLVADNGYLPGNTAEGTIYQANGNSDDWGYGDTAERPKIFSFTPEVGSFADGGFGPDESFITPYFNQLLEMNLLFLEIGGEPGKVLGPVSPIIQSLAVTAPSQLILGWAGNLPLDPNPAVTYELEYFHNMSLQPIVDAETTSSFINLNGGFAASGTRASQGLQSYYSGRQNNQSATLTAAAPLRVTPTNSVFSAMMWFDIEPDFDYAYVEVSEDQGLVWRPIAGNVTTNVNPFGGNRGHGITGNSGGWMPASFPLTDYIGQEILLRIHYSTDGGVLNEGLYIDEFGPISRFDARGIVATGIPSNTLTFAPGVAGTYSYRVRGQDAEADNGPWSGLFDAEVGTATDASAIPPVAHGLGQNFPNPFNPRTSIPYTVGARGQTDLRRQVELAIFDIRGQHVRTIVDELRAPGHYRATWNGRNEAGEALGSGSYFARLLVDGEINKTRKLVLLK